MGRFGLFTICITTIGAAAFQPPWGIVHPHLRVSSQVATCRRVSTSPLNAPAPLAQTERTTGVLMQNRLPGGGGFGGFQLESLIGPALLGALFFSGALGWLFNLVVGLQLLLLAIPVVAVPLFQWWLSSNLLEGACPTCGLPNQLLKGQAAQCPECGTIFDSELNAQGIFMRQPSQTGEGVIEVDVDVLD